ncbi:MAG: hypothetical protein ABI857_12470 [Acidobacteriota bacterium]
MKHIKVSTRYLSCITFLLTAFLLSAVMAPAQSRDPDSPTPISGFPLTGRLPAGTYYYAVPVNAGPGTMGLQVNAPTGGASISVSLSGPDCCSAEGYASASTGREEIIRGGSDPFTVPSAQTLLVTINISVAAGDTAGFTLSLNIGGGSGVIVTPPPSPTPTPTLTATSPGCTDLSVDGGFRLTGPASAPTINFIVRNLSPTRYVGHRRLQWVELLDTTKARETPILLKQVLFTEVPARGSIPFALTNTSGVSTTLPQRYMVRIVYSPFNATDRLTTNDDCISENNWTDGRPRLIFAERP